MLQNVLKNRKLSLIVFMLISLSIFQQIFFFHFHLLQSLAIQVIHLFHFKSSDRVSSLLLQLWQMRSEAKHLSFNPNLFLAYANEESRQACYMFYVSYDAVGFMLTRDILMCVKLVFIIWFGFSFFHIGQIVTAVFLSGEQMEVTQV